MIFSKNRYSILVILSISLVFYSTIITPVYADAPTAAITYSSAGPYKSGDEITITATFNEAVKDSPVPKIAITGENSVSATAMTKTSTTVYTYSHTVAAGNGNASVVMSVALDVEDNEVVATPTSGATFVVDNTAPTAAITYSRTGQYEKNDTVTITATFNEAVKDSPVPKIAITGENSVSATAMTKTSTTVYTYSHTVDYGSGNASVVMSVALDAAGNAVTSTPTSGATFVVDNKSSFSNMYPPHIHDEVIVSINSNEKFVLNMKDTDVTNISANVGDKIDITISVGDDKEIGKISPIKLITNFAKKPHDMNAYFTTNFDDYGQVGLSVYEVYQNKNDIKYDFDETFTWNESTIRKQKFTGSIHDYVGYVSTNEQELLITYSMESKKTMLQSQVTVKISDDEYMQNQIILPFTLEILPNVDKNPVEQTMPEPELKNNEKLEFFIKADKSEYSHGNKITITGQIPSDDFNPVNAENIKFSITSPEKNVIIAGEFAPNLDGSFTYDVFAMNKIWKTDGDYIFNLHFNSIVSNLIIHYDNTEFENSPVEPITPPVVEPITPPVATPVVKESNSTPLGIALFVDTSKNPQHYIDRYFNEPKYKEWFDKNYPQYISIYQAVGLEEPITPPVVEPITPPVVEPITPPVVEPITPPVVEPIYIEVIIPECGVGTEDVNGICQVIQTNDESKGGGCLIATATYGSEMSQQVQQLRELRDNQLLNTESGTQFMSTFNDIYYSFSPIIADYERENPYFKEAVKLVITPMISTLSIMESAETESEVLGLGLSVIALNLAMYLGVPAIVVIGIKKRI